MRERFEGALSRVEWCVDTATPCEAEIEPDAPPETVQEFLGAFDSIQVLHCRHATISPTTWKLIASRPHLQRLDLWHSTVPEEGIELLGQNGKLRWLSLYGCQLSDRQLDAVAQITSIQSLYVDGHVSRSVCSWIARLPDLTALGLSHAALESEGIRELANCRQLKWLDISGTAVDDSTIASVGSIKSLTTVNISRTRLTADGVMALLVLPDLDAVTAFETSASHDALMKFGELYRSKWRRVVRVRCSGAD